VAPENTAQNRAHARLSAIVSRGSGALVPALQSTLIEAELARDVVDHARALRLAQSGQERADAMGRLFAAVDALDGAS
jgi:hypothetical protein